jgi:hypothetical protein
LHEGVANGCVGFVLAAIGEGVKNQGHKRLLLVLLASLTTTYDGVVHNNGGVLILVRKILLGILRGALLAGGAVVYLILRHNALLLDDGEEQQAAKQAEKPATKWIKVSTHATSTIYLDSATSKRVGNNIMIWLLRDYNGPQFDGTANYLSSKDQIEVDCYNQRVRRIYSSNHPQSMGGGDFVSSEHGPMSWNDVTGDSIIRRAIDIACTNS